MKKSFLSLFMGLITTVSMFASSNVTLTVGDYQATSFSAQGISVTAAKAGAANDPAYNATSHDLRVYANGTLTVSANQAITHISFDLSAQGQRRLCPLTSNVGTMTVVGDPDFTVDWSGSSSLVTITVGAKADYGTDGSAKAGQLAFKALTVTLEGDVIDDPVVTPTYNGDTLDARTVVSNAQEYGSDVELIFKGYVTSIQQQYNEASHTVSFGVDNEYWYDMRPVLIAYRVRCNREEDAPKLGDLVWVKGRVTVTQSYPVVKVQTIEGGSFGIIQRAGDVIFLYDDFEGGVESSGGEVSYTRSGVTVYTNRGYGNEMIHSLRVYSGAVFEITSEDEVMSKIRFTFDESYDRDYSGGLSREIIVNSKTWRVESMKAQARITRIDVYFGGEENQAVELISAPENSRKIMKDGAMYILRGDKTYTLTGQEIK